MASHRLLPPSADWLPRGDEGDENVVDDLAQDVVGDGLERHHHFVPEQIEREINKPGGEPGRVGAGKTTTIRILLGLLLKDGGEVSLLGADPWRDAVELHQRLAYVPAM